MLARELLIFIIFSLLFIISLKTNIANLETNQSINGLEGYRFTDEGAKAYSKAARYEFQKHAAIKGLDIQKALEQLKEIAIKHQGDIEFIVQILMGRHELTGDEMIRAIESTGNCPMQKSLQEWSGDPLAALCKVFVDAMEL